MKPKTRTEAIRSAKRARRERWERLLDNHLAAIGLPEALPEYRFYQHQGRRWRFDRAYPEHRVGIEVEGLVWTGGGGRHQRPRGYTEDCHKYNAAALEGWVVLRFTPEMIRSGHASRLVAELLERRRSSSGPASVSERTRGSKALRSVCASRSRSIISAPPVSSAVIMWRIRIMAFRLPHGAARGKTALVIARGTADRDVRLRLGPA